MAYGIITIIIVIMGDAVYYNVNNNKMELPEAIKYILSIDYNINNN